MPLTVFLLDYCIRYPAASMTDVATNELEIISSVDQEYGGRHEQPAVATKEKVKVQMGKELGQLG